MKAAVARRYGGPEVIEIVDLPRPHVGPKDVLVKVRATTVSAGDMRLRSAKVPRGFGLFVRLAFGIRRPRKPVLGWELAGVVEAVGSSVKRFAAGAAVFATLGSRMGAHAEYVAISEDKAIVLMPGVLSFAEAAALSFGGTTALAFLRDRGKVQPGERVLINGASGAVGSAAVQLAKHFGANVTGVCSAANAELVRSLGADRVIDYATEDFARESEAYDVILDAVGNAPFERSRTALTDGGRLLLVVADLPQTLGASARRSRSGRKVFAGPVAERVEYLQTLRALAEAGAYKPVIDRIYPFERIAEAHARVETGHKVGNVVVTFEEAG